nr:hypothetical protein [Tanacetum cinerariifolium]
MDMTIDQKMALDEVLIPYARRLRIGRSNFRLLLDISSKESTLQLVYDVLRQTPFFKAFLVTIDVEHKDTKKSNEMYYPRFTKVIIHHFMSKDLSIPRRNKVNWYYVRDDQMFTTIKLESRHQNTQQFDAMLPIELTNAEIRNSEAYKEYYAVATGATPPKTKASVRKTKSSSDTIVTPPPTAATGTRLFTSTKGKQPATTSKAKSLTALSEGDDEEAESDRESEEEETREQEEESFDLIPRTPKDSEDDGNGEEDQGLRISEEERMHKEEEADELYRDVDINQGRGLQISQDIEDSHVTLTLTYSDGQQESSEILKQKLEEFEEHHLESVLEELVGGLLCGCCHDGWSHCRFG